MHHCRSVTLLAVWSLLLHRVIQRLQSSLYGLVIIGASVKLVQGVLRGEGRGRQWYSGEMAKLVSAEMCSCRTVCRRYFTQAHTTQHSAATEEQQTAHIVLLVRAENSHK